MSKVDPNSVNGLAIRIAAAVQLMKLGRFRCVTLDGWTVDVREPRPKKQRKAR